MTKFTLTALTFLATMAMSTAAYANDWQCTASNSSSSAALCYVSYVRYFPGNTAYVKAKLHDPDNKTGCDYVRVEIGTGSAGAQTREDVRSAEAVLLTALTTGMPIKFWRLTAHGTSRDCVAGTVIIAKPGH